MPARQEVVKFVPKEPGSPSAETLKPLTSQCKEANKRTFC
jgi:hypothetical protein